MDAWVFWGVLLLAAPPLVVPVALLAVRCRGVFLAFGVAWGGTIAVFVGLGILLAVLNSGDDPYVEIGRVFLILMAGMLGAGVGCALGFGCAQSVAVQHRLRQESAVFRDGKRRYER